MMRGRRPAVLAALAAAAALAVVAPSLGLAGPGSAAPPLGGTVAKFTLAAAARPAPTVPVLGMDGRQHNLAEFRGKVVALNFWATWCVPCVKEMPALDRLQAALGGDRFQVVLVSEDRAEPATVRAFLDRLGLKRLDSLRDPLLALFRAYDGKGLPTTILLDRDGAELGRLEGPAEWDEPEAQALIRHYLQ